MLKEITLCGINIQYNMEYKNVKNINLRIKPDSTVNVSASHFVPIKTIEDFLQSKGEFIIKVLKKYSAQIPVPVQCFSEFEVKSMILQMCDEAYSIYKEKGIKYPQIKFQKMTSRWGSCNPKKGILKFNTNLMYAPKECIEYVVYHEFTHFLQANHSKKFYDELTKVFPNWKTCITTLKNIPIGRC